MTVAVWIVSGLAALLFVAAGAAKILRPKAAIQEQMAWAADFSGGQIKAIGALEILGAVGLTVPVATGILPILTPIAALGLIVIQIGAIVVHARRRETGMIVVNLVLIALAAFVGVGRFLGF